MQRPEVRHVGRVVHERAGAGETHQASQSRICSRTVAFENGDPQQVLPRRRKVGVQTHYSLHRAQRLGLRATE